MEHEEYSLSNEIDKNGSYTEALPPETHNFEFHGNSLEYFRIWFTNIFLTIISLGIYAPWAKVRTKKYFYRNTILNGEPFDYTGNPYAILKGYAIIIAAFIPVAIFQHLYPEAGGLITILVYLCVIPYLIYKSLKFNARNLLYRNISCSFKGTPGESYKINAGLVILIPFTLGLIFPYWDFRRRQYIFSNLSYGNAAFDFKGGAGSFYKYYTIASLIPLLFLFLLGFLGGICYFAMNQADPQMLINIFPEIAGIDLNSIWIAAAVVAYIVFILSIMVVKQYIFVTLTNYTMNGLSIPLSMTFHSDIKIIKYLFIQFVNFLAILFSVGLLYPWAKVRKMKYVTECMTVTAFADFDSFVAVSTPDVSAIGDAGADLFDIDIAL